MTRAEFRDGHAAGVQVLYHTLVVFSPPSLGTELRQAAYGVGTTRWGAIINVILPAAISGIIGGVMLALGRAMGETMAVTMIIGNSNNFNVSLLAPGNTIVAMLANQFG